MILFGAGSSIPFDIPGMAGFTEQFVAEHKEISGLLGDIKAAVSKSDENIGIPFSFDLEALLSVLNDLSGAKPQKPISVMTTALLLNLNLNIKEAREKYKAEASIALNKLREFVFNTCIQPIKKGKEKGNFRFLNDFYGPLMTILNTTGIENIQEPAKKIFSTNWDLCFKTWVDYVNIPINDGTDIDQQSLPILDIEKKFVQSSPGFSYVPLHGSIDLIKMRRLKGEGIYEDVFKIPDPIGYFEDKPDNIKDVFMIYPLEAVGYDETIRSPYLDMLNYFRSSLRGENIIFIIGYSLRDPTIGSIFEEVIAERIRRGNLSPLSEDIDSRKNQVREHSFKIVVINPEPIKLVENLRKQFNTNLLQTFVPIKIRFPKISDEKFDEKYTQTLYDLIVNLVHIHYIDTEAAQRLSGVLKSKYGLFILSKQNFPWKK